MSNLKEVRTRIESVNSTMQITSAMKMVSASKLRKSQNAILNMRPYASKLRELMQNLAPYMGKSEMAKYTEQPEVKKVLLVPVTSNRGLCGAFNTSIIRHTVKLAVEQYNNLIEENNLAVFCIGKKGDDFFKKYHFQYTGSEIQVFDHLNFEHIIPLAEYFMRLFVEKEFDRIVFVYNQFRSAGTQVIVEEQLLPLELPPQKIDELDDGVSKYIFEPDQQQILDTLVPKTIKMQVYKMILDSFASEHGARMIAMHKATDNATEMLKELKLSYNKARQAAITNEIIEIVGGAEAL
ncbi:MAG: ATP synthase F1 subunit gamma [Bacteroidales bacterium]|nr:ATP synthase F1 subunit gamma [Bacteroidales bacterium]